MSANKSHTPHVVIVGAGIAGISAAIGLKRRLNFDNFTIFEKAEEVGGTWRENKYPGCGSDVPGHWYSLSTDLNPNWQTYYVSQPEIRAYWEGLWRKYNLDTHTTLDTTVVQALWDSENQRYTIHIENAKTKKKETVVAHAIFWAIGGFQEPLYPKDIPGREHFSGDLFHSAAWRHDVCLKQKRVGVIGNGCSAAQFIPQISKDRSVEVTNFCRTPQWFISDRDYTYPKWIKWMFAHVPLVMWAYRSLLMAGSDFRYIGFRKDNTRILAKNRKALTAYIARKAPKDEKSNLIPNYTPGCKRFIVDRGYLDSLSQPNVNIKWDTIERIEEFGIRLKTGELIALDVIIFATGFKMDFSQLNVTGSHGSTMKEYFTRKGGPTAYVGACVPHFPNSFLLFGPNIATGHASVLFSEEAQINFAIQLLRPILEGKAKSFEITDEATDKYNAWLQARLQRSVWTDCISYYQAGRNDKTHIIATFPGPVALFWWICRRPDWKMFHAVGAEAWQRQLRSSASKEKFSITALCGLCIVSLYLMF